MATDLNDRQTNGERTRNLRQSLVHLHRALLNAEIDRYARDNGIELSAGERFNLAVSEPSLDWLRVLSQLIVRFDELIDSSPTEAESQMAKLENEVGAWREVDLLFSAQEPTEPERQSRRNQFRARYTAVLQVSPESVLAHVQVLSALNQKAENEI